MDTLLDKLASFYDKHGCSTIAAIAFFMVIFGFIPSPMLKNQDLLMENQRIMLEHSKDSRERTSQLARSSLAQCVNPAIERKDKVAVRICLEESEYKQKKMIEEAIDGTSK